MTLDAPWPVDSGAATRNWHLFAALRSEGFCSDIAYFQGPSDASENLSGVFDHRFDLKHSYNKPIAALRSLLSRHPYLVHKFFDKWHVPQLQRIINDGDYDFLMFETFLAAYVPYLTINSYIYSTHNVDHVFIERQAQHAQGLWRVFYSIQARKMERFERQSLRSASAGISVSDVDRALFDRMGTGKPVLVVPNGVDVARFRPATPPGAGIYFFGNMHYQPNSDGLRWFVRRVLPIIRSRSGNVPFRVIGKASNALRSELSQGVEWLGFVPDVNAAVAEAAVVVAPLRFGAGTKLKVLEALAMGKALVTTTIGAEGLAVRHGEHVWIADGAETFADGVVTLLEDPARRSQFGIAARKLVEDRYDWRTVAASFAASLRHLMLDATQSR